MEYLQKILNVEQIRLADAYTIKHEPIPSIELMERASNAFVNAIEDQLDTSQSIAVVCGPGNNGGDGLAIARILQWKGYDVQAFLFRIGAGLSPDCAINFKKLDTTIECKVSVPLPDLSKFDVIIDGLFGSGLSRPVEGWPKEIIDSINATDSRVYAIDIPSGMYCDKLPEGNHMVRADHTITFQRPKLAFFYPESSEFVGVFKWVDIGLNERFIQNQPTKNYVLDGAVSRLLKKRKRYSHKGSYGHAIIIAGSRGKMGAAVLCGKGCLRSGVGLLTTHIPACGLVIAQVALPEAMCSIDRHEYHFSTVPDINKHACVGIGPGLGVTIETKQALRTLLEQVKVPLVLDADALNILSENQELKALIPEFAILTPHPKEFERLVGAWEYSEERLTKQISFSKKHNCIVVLKDAHTVISDPEGRVFFNTSGNPGMATGGSGDVLTGIITGLLAQSYTPLEAALIGVYYHGLAGDRAAAANGENAVIAGDLAAYLRIDDSLTSNG